MTHKRVVDIVAVVSEATAIGMVDIMGPCRRGAIARARFAAYKLAREAGHSFPEIGRRMGGKDHSSVINGVNRAVFWEDNDSDFQALMKALRARVADMVPFMPDDALMRAVEAARVKREREKREAEEAKAKAIARREELRQRSREQTALAREDWDEEQGRLDRINTRKGSEKLAKALWQALAA